MSVLLIKNYYYIRSINDFENYLGFWGIPVKKIISLGKG
jgi:hypothetical protein